MLPIREVTERLWRGEVIILPTDTVYGLSCLVSNHEAADRIFRIKNRNSESPLVTLIGDISQLPLLGIDPTEGERKLMNAYWPGPLTIEFRSTNELLRAYRGIETITVRLPAYPELTEIISLSGPIISTSANISGQPPAKTIDEARGYFGDQVDAYYDAGTLEGQPSTIVRIVEDKVEMIRRGGLSVG